jgi:UDP-glucuronate decarboxylase
MAENDGRVVSNFIVQALTSDGVTVFGDGSQTRSFCYVSDTVKGLVLLMNGEHVGPINIGNPNETTVLTLAQKIASMVDPERAQIIFKPLPADDPTKRKPDITKARTLLGWEPQVDFEVGLKSTIEYFRKTLQTKGKISS